MYRQAEGFVLRTPGMRDRFKCQEGYRRIKCLRTGGRLAGVRGGRPDGDGIIPGGIALVDELHRHRDLRLYRVWVGKLVKRGAQIVTISTAGEPASEFEETRERIQQTATTSSGDGCHVRAAARTSSCTTSGCRSAKLADDMEVVAEANPRADITAEVLRKKRESPTMTDEHWLRFVCNIATRADGSPITPRTGTRCARRACRRRRRRRSAGSTSAGRSTRPRSARWCGSRTSAASSPG
jgi:phage terminase large subunit-like protein